MNEPVTLLEINWICEKNKPKHLKNIFLIIWTMLKATQDFVNFDYQLYSQWNKTDYNKNMFIVCFNVKDNSCTDVLEDVWCLRMWIVSAHRALFVSTWKKLRGKWTAASIRPSRTPLWVLKASRTILGSVWQSCCWAWGEAVFWAGVAMRGRQMFLGQVSDGLGLILGLTLASYCVLCVFLHIRAGFYMRVDRFTAYRWPPELPRPWKACSSPPRSCSWARRRCCPGPRGAAFSSGRRPGRPRSRPAGWWPWPGSRPGPGEPGSPPRSSSASHTAGKHGDDCWNGFISDSCADYVSQGIFRDWKALSKCIYPSFWKIGKTYKSFHIVFLDFGLNFSAIPNMLKR